MEICRPYNIYWNVGKPFLCCTVCKVSMDGGPTEVNAVNLHFVVNWFYALSCAMVHSNHRWPSISKFQKPLKNHWNQWLDPPKTFNCDGPKVLKPLKNHRSQWWPKKNINHSIALKNWPSLWSTIFWILKAKIKTKVILLWEDKFLD